MQYTPFGAAGGVTGSRHLLTTGDKSILLDCGMFQGEGFGSLGRNDSLPFLSKDISAVVLSHGHIDHSGSLPTLVKAGFRGPIYATSATRDVAELMLLDTAHIQEQDAAYQKKHHDPRHNGITEPLYDESDVLKTMGLFQNVEYGECREIGNSLSLCFYNAGHILGSSLVHLTAQEEGRPPLRIGYTGDLGKKDMPILNGPDRLPETDVLLSESTYGNRSHGSMEEAELKLQQVVEKAQATGGKIFVPTFALGRMQSFIYTLHRLVDRGALKPIPIYVDSPLGNNLTKVFSSHPECFDEETKRLFVNRKDPPFQFPQLKYVESVEESKRLNTLPGPMMIVASSGMVEGGRILHHLKNGLGDPKNVVLVVGYMAKGTTGRALVEKATQVKIFHVDVPVRAQIEVINAFSAHADQDELSDFIGSVPELKRLLLVHGDEESRSHFRALLKERFPNLNVDLPVFGKTYDLSQPS